LPTIREHGLRPLQPCSVCQTRTRRVCDCCGLPICLDHTVSHVQMHWETWHTVGRNGASWTRYLPNGVLLHVCPACKAHLTAKDVVELARDQRSVRDNFLWYGMGIPAVFFVLFGLPYLLGHFVCR
jgi:predicted phosphoadenosine phosphosulfate sulfurtransferase